ncbi:MAG: hypothetical protein QG574_98 [Cyanobacteriota bacterium erpe_2018_sw_21hr_WHONDRS-SW48-000092_B_bin.40]|nr:hypothetical protein [Cyanobacteriota bacterium erpe_2018_sw_21hr_WHONDRS-SW48-000092_B_bin.40]
MLVGLLFDLLILAGLILFGLPGQSILCGLNFT